MLITEEVHSSILNLPSVEDFIHILHSCKKKKTLSSAQNVHMRICNCGLETHVHLGNHLLLMLVECESMLDAQQVFNRLPYRNENSWTSLIQGYTESGDSEHAIILFHEMQEEYVDPSMHTFVALLKACAKLKSIVRGREMHSEIAKEGFERELFIGSVLVDMYAKCNSLAEAQEVFDELPERNVVSWTALMAGYAECGLCEQVLNCLEQMQCEGVCPNAVTLICTLKACTGIRAIDRGLEIHSRILKEGLERDLIVGNTLVDMYAKRGLLKEARVVFEQLPARNVVLWTALIAGYAEHGFGEEALKCLEQMKLDLVRPDSVTFVCGLKACSSIGAINRGREIHAEIVRAELERDLYIGNTVVDMYAKCGLIEEAREVFEELQVRNVVSWNAMMGGYADRAGGEEALNCFELMQLEGMSPDVVSWTAVILGYAEQGESEEALKLFAKMLEQGILPNNITFVSILKACGNTASLEAGRVVHAQIYKAGRLEEASEVILSTALVDMYGKCGSMVDAQQIFDAMPARDHVAWNALITGYACQGETELVTCLVERMKMEDIPPDETAILSVLTVCSHAGLIDKGWKYLEVMSKEYGVTPTVRQLNCMVDLLCRAGLLNEAVEMVEKVPARSDLVTWSTILSACQKWGDLELGRQAFEHVVRLDDGHDAAYILISNILSCF